MRHIAWTAAVATIALFAVAPEANVLAIGDPGGPDRYPHISAGGGTDGMIAGTGGGGGGFPGSEKRANQDRAGTRPLGDQGGFSGLSRRAGEDPRPHREIEGRRQGQEPAAPKPMAPDIQAQQKQDDAASERIVRAVYQTLA